MHILIIPSEEFLPVFSETTGIFQYHQAKVLQDAGHKVGVISISQSFSFTMIAKGLFFKLARKKVNNACDNHSFSGLIKLAYRKVFRPTWFLQQETVRGISVLRIDGLFYRPPVENKNHYGWIKAGLAAYKEYIRLNGVPEIIHAHNAVYAGMLCQAIEKRYRVPYIVTEHSTAFARKVITSEKILQRIKAAYNRSVLLSCVSEPFCHLLNQQFAFNRFRCLHNVLDPDFENREINIQEKNDEFVFINIAELHPKKDHFTLINAFKEVYLKHPQARLWIGGEGILSEELHALVAKENLQEAVRFLGLLNRDQVFDAMGKADCFVLSSKYETFGVVVIEAMLLGKPVIATKCGGPESFVRDFTGIIVNKENKAELVQAMSEMLHRLKRYDAGQIREYAIQTFGAASFLNNVMQLYKDSLDQYWKSNRTKSASTLKAMPLIEQD
jgi:glycosyltransferase involved in cell wall biosynthesis